LVFHGNVNGEEIVMEIVCQKCRRESVHGIFEDEVRRGGPEINNVVFYVVIFDFFA
jgi:hypothetical protein